MSYTVWIAVENDDTAEVKWWSVNHHPTAEEAMEHAQDIANVEYSRTGVEPVLLDD